MTRPIKQRHPLAAPVWARHAGIRGFDQERLSQAHVLIIGAGGLGGEIGHGLARKGVGALTILDHDTVDLTNLARQRFFERDLGKNKALALIRNLAPEATGKSLLTAYPCSFQDAVAGGVQLDGDVVVCGVDNDQARVDVARHFLNKRPVVFAGTSRDADSAYVFVQEPGRACFVCQFPDSAVSPGSAPCVPSEIGILKAICGYALFAIDSLLMSRPRLWTFRAVSLSGSWEERTGSLKSQERCPLCSSGGGR